MDIIKKNLTIPYMNNYLMDEYWDSQKICTFDIETLGLDPMKAPMILAGMMVVEPDGNAEVTQYFLDEPEEEHILLEEVIKELNSYDCLITYNGKRFDLPYLIKRYRMIYHEEPKIRPFDLDLYQFVRHHSSLCEFMESLSQKSIERYMGLAPMRTDEISGAESVRLYYEYITEADLKLRRALKETILLHNFDDVVQLYKLLPIVNQCDVHSAFNKLGFPVVPEAETEGGRLLKPSSIKIVKRSLIIKGSYFGEPIAYKGFSTMETPWESEFKADGSFTLTLPLLKDADALYVNLFDYFQDTQEFWGMAGYVNDYLILKNGKEINTRDMNLFSRAILRKLDLNII
jgi:uncharacterized protein YprB with RNaseH-like and TPR domain